ncbi:MAG: hypothetical protein Tsb0013_07030 [Phycisphaerales bacterium]
MGMHAVLHGGLWSARGASVDSGMPALLCPQCRAVIPPDVLVDGHETIICRACLFPQDRASLVETDASVDETPPPDPAQPPAGCRVIERDGAVRLIGARTALYVCEVRIRGDVGEIRDGLPLFVRADEFVVGRTTAIRVEHDPITGRPPSIVLTDGERHAFGARLGDDARAWMAAALRMVVLGEV